MKWIEIISLRSSDAKARTVVKDAATSLAGGKHEGSLSSVVQYTSVGFLGGSCIMLVHESDHVIAGKSTLGLMLASSMKEHGLVDHSVWIEEVIG